MGYLQSAEISTTYGADPVTIASSPDVMLVSALLGHPMIPSDAVRATHSLRAGVFLGDDSAPLSDDHFHAPLSDDHFHGNTRRAYGITACERIQRSHFTPRDRDIPTASPLEGRSVLNLAGQASAEERNDEINLLMSETELTDVTELTHINAIKSIGHHATSMDTITGKEQLVDQVEIGSAIETHHGHKIKATLRNNIASTLANTFETHHDEHGASSSIISRDRDISAHLLHVDGLVHDLAGQASPDDMDDQITIIPVHDLVMDLANPRDHDTSTAPPLEGGLVLNIVGQAINDETILESNHHRLRHIHDSVATKLDSLVLQHTQLLLFELNGKQEGDVINESKCNTKAGNDGGSLILMIRDEEVLRTIETMRAIAIEIADDSNDTDVEMAEQRDHELELNQMNDDVLYEVNAATERIETAYGEIYQSGSDTYIYGDPDSDGYDNDVSSVDENNPYPYSYPCLPEFADDDINENTDTDDGVEEVIELIGTNARLVALVAKQGGEVIELIGVNTQLVALVARQRKTMARLRARINRLLDFIKQHTAHSNPIAASHLDGSSEILDGTAVVLMDT
jgi:hypothetical protein